MIGVNKGEVWLAPHSSDWKNLFNKENELLSSLIGQQVVDIQHIGSTAIRGIDAKPIIDILVGVQSMEDVKKFNNERLKEKGYYHLPRVQIEGKVVYAKFKDLEKLTKTHILHVVEYEGEWWNQHSFFRDYLINNPNVAKEYEIFKKSLLNDERSYTDKKKQFVDDILNKR